MMVQDYVVGLDGSTQTFKVLIVALDGRIISVGSSDTLMIKGPNGEREGKPSEWRLSLRAAIKKAIKKARQKGVELGNCLGICPSGMMHGEVLILDDGSFYLVARLWCDSRNADEGRELTELFEHKIPKRVTIARWLWTIRNRPEIAKHVIGITTPAGALARFLGAKDSKLGLGEACGMFPVNPDTLNYYPDMVAKFDALVAGKGVLPIFDLLPQPVMVGDIVGHVDKAAAKFFGITEGAPIFSPEGDQPMSLAGTYSYAEGHVSFSGGTSIVRNHITSKPFNNFRDPAVEPFMTVDGKRFLMICVQNGTSAMNIFIEKLFGPLVGKRDPFDVVRELAANAPVDCGGIFSLSLAEAEHTVNLGSGAVPIIVGMRGDNATPGNLVRASFVGSIFNALYGVKAMEEAGISATEIIASGGIAKSPWTFQVVADMLKTPVRVMGDSKNCSPYGAALVALYGLRKQIERGLSWSVFLKQMRPTDSEVIKPKAENMATYDKMFPIFCGLIKKVEPELLALTAGK